MQLPWDWILAVILLGAGSYFAISYYRLQSEKYSQGEHNEDMDRFRGGGSCCH